MSQPGQPQSSMESWVRSLISALLVVAGSYHAVTTEIHGYIDTRMDSAVREIKLAAGDVAQGQMLQVMDTVQAMDARMARRLEALEQQVIDRPEQTTVVVPADTLGLRRMHREMEQIRHSIELLLDGTGKDRRIRAHNARPE